MTLIEAVKAMGNGKIYQISDPKNIYKIGGKNNKILCRVFSNGDLATRAMLIEEILAEDWEIIC